VGLLVGGLLVPSMAEATDLFWPFAFTDRFPANSQHLGFVPGYKLALGVFVVPGDAPVVTVTARNLDSEVAYEITSEDIGVIKAGLYQVIPMPDFDPDLHAGVWEIEAVDSDGESVFAFTHDLNEPFPMPYPRAVEIWDPWSPTPTVTWAPAGLKEADVQDCYKVRYRLRLLTSIKNQIFETSDMDTYSYTFPEGVVPDDPTGLYVRIETRCYSDENHPVPLENRSEVFRPLVDDTD